MPIEIRVVERAGRPWPDPTPVRFDAAGGEIGRGADCTLQLEDPDRRISRKQAAIIARDGRFFLRQLRETCPIELRGRILAPGEDVELAAGDEVRIGPYVLQVAAIHQPAARNDPLAMFASAAEARNPLRELIDLPKPAPGHRFEAVDIPVGDATGMRPRTDSGVDAFLDAAGARALPVHLRSPELMRAAGTLFRVAIEGVLELLAARSVEKREFHADATSLKARENNPLKFSPNADTALAHLLGGSLPGFMPPEEALRDAFKDLGEHQVAVLAAMRSAVAALIERIDPKALEDRLATRPGWNALVPGGRKGQLWDLYTSAYTDVAKEIFDTESAFGRAFQATYLQQLEMLRRK